MRSIVYNQFCKELHIITATPWISSTVLTVVYHHCESIFDTHLKVWWYTALTDWWDTRATSRPWWYAIAFAMDKKIDLQMQVYFWWERVDSNHWSQWRQIYSLFPLAARELSHIKLWCVKWSWWTDLNPRPADYKSAALPTELHQRFERLNILS